TGWTVGYEGKIVKTTNSGQNWIPQTIGSVQYFSVFFINQTTGWVSDWWGGILKTTNAGLNWLPQTSGTNKRLYEIFFINENTGWAVGFYPGNGIIINTTNGGINWTTQFQGFQELDAVYFVNPLKGWVVGKPGVILYTTDGGNNWTQQNSGVTNSLYSVNFISESTGWAVGTQGKILKTTTGGIIVGNKSQSNKLPVSYKLYQNYPNPFNPTTTIKFSLPEKCYTSLIIYDVLGKETAKLIDSDLKGGEYEIIWNADNFNSGIYFCTLTAGNYKKTVKLVLAK
ncbi:MAG: T9SS C-terminal target domain-containing protein, partial [Ignavibacteriae bacterium]